eukprot:Opistho-2@26663
MFARTDTTHYCPDRPAGWHVIGTEGQCLSAGPPSPRQRLGCLTHLTLQCAHIGNGGVRSCNRGGTCDRRRRSIPRRRQLDHLHIEHLAVMQPPKDGILQVRQTAVHCRRACRRPLRIHQAMARIILAQSRNVPRRSLETKVRILKRIITIGADIARCASTGNQHGVADDRCAHLRGDFVPHLLNAFFTISLRFRGARLSVHVRRLHLVLRQTAHGRFHRHVFAAHLLKLRRTGKQRHLLVGGKHADGGLFFLLDLALDRHLPGPFLRQGIHLCLDYLAELRLPFGAALLLHNAVLLVDDGYIYAMHCADVTWNG